MLSKLIKYDIRSTWRDFSGVYLAILLGVILVPLMLNNINNEIVSMIAGSLAFGIVVTVIVILIVNLFKIYNTNVLSKQGYLTMTLPVTAAQVVLSKLIVSTMWIVLTGFVSLIGIFIFITMIDPNSFSEITKAFQEIMAQIDSQSVFTIILLVLATIFSAVKEVAKLFLACSIAHLKQLNRFRIPAGIISYFVFSWFETFLVQLVTKILSLFPNLDELMDRLNAISNLSSFEQAQSLFNGVIGLGILYTLALAIVFSAGTVWILNHKLDLE